MIKVAIKKEVQLVVIECGKCGINFGVPERFDEQRRQTGEGFYCPNGHCRAYTITELDRLKSELAQAAKNLEISETRRRRASERADELERSRSAIKGQVTKLKNRIAKGICPCCNRSFTNLWMHMSTEHPEFTQDHDDIKQMAQT